MKKKKKTSLADIAKALGVSSTLVSMVLNGRGDKHGISISTQERVRKKAKELNYRPNPIARGLRTGKSNTIGLVVTDIGNDFYAKIARRIEDKASKLGYHLIFCSSDENAEKETELIHMLKSRQVDGLILATTLQDTTLLQQLTKEAYPLVLIDRQIEGLETNSVVIDNYQSTFDAMQHLIDQGHQHIGLLTLSTNHISTIQDRQRGYQEALIANKLPADPDYYHQISLQNIQEQTNQALDQLLRSATPVSAIFVVNNSLAKACLTYFKQHKIQVPQDLAMIAFDDIDVFEFCTPTVSAIAQPLQAIGDYAVQLLLDKIKAPHTPLQQIVLSPTLVLRQSSELVKSVLKS